jgi:oligopeptide transport system substrate-binding protein
MTMRSVCKRWSSALIASLALAGCTPSETPKIQGPTQELKLYLQADLLSVDPRIGYDRRSIQVIRELFEGLVRIGESGKPELALASSYTVSDDGTVYTFHLRPAKWSNGMDVTAEDFVYAWKTTLNNTLGTTGAYVLYVIKNARKANINECSIDEVGVRALDPSTLEVTLEHPAPYFFEFLDLPIFSPVCKAAVEKNLNWARGVSPDYVCNGPYILKDRRLKSHITLERNPYYKGPKPGKTERLNFAIIEDPQTAYNMFQEGSLDWCGDTCGNMSLEMVYDLNRKGQLIKQHSGGAQWLFCNVEQPHLASAKIRKAIACAIDRQEICDKLLQGGETPSYSLVLRSMSLLKDQPFEYNPTLARQLFEEGMAELGYTRETFPTIVFTHFSEPTIQAVVEAEQEQIQKNLGIKVDLLSGDWSTFMKRFVSGNYQLLSMVWFTFYQDPMYNLEVVKHRKQGINNTGWENAKYISLLDQADQSVDPIVRNSYLQQAERLLMEELPVIPVFYHTFKYAKAPHLNGEALSGAGQMELRWLEKAAAG